MNSKTGIWAKSQVFASNLAASAEVSGNFKINSLNNTVNNRIINAIQIINFKTGYLSDKR